MNQSLERILINLAGNKDLQQVSLGELEKIADEHPYFSIPHLLLINKLQFEGAESFEKKAQLTALYTHNPWWLHYQLTAEMQQMAATKSELLLYSKEATDNTTGLSRIVDDNIHAKETHLFVVPPQDREKVLLTDGDDNVSPEMLLTETSTLPVLQEVMVECGNNQPVHEEELDEDPRFEKQEIEETNDDEVLHADIEEEDDGVVVETETPGDNVNKRIETEGPIIGEEVAHELELVPITNEFTLQELEEAGKLAHETLSEVTSKPDSHSLFTLPGKEAPEIEVPITTEFTQQELDASSRLAHAALADSSAEPNSDSLFALPVYPGEESMEEEMKSEIEQNPLVEVVRDTWPETDKSENGEKSNEAPGLKALHTSRLPFSEDQLKEWEENATEEQPEIELPDASPEAYSNNQMLQNIKSILNTPLTTNKSGAQSLIPIDPYYTVDYFASQGIKLVLENEPTDQLGKKLKKFTHWLKHMKKLGPEDALENENEDVSEATVIRIADFSNTQREIITEAMAAVLEKQGKKEKAIQIYIKLSFLYPDKSAYFADKIKILKGIK